MTHSAQITKRHKLLSAILLTLVFNAPVTAIDHEPLTRSAQMTAQTVLKHALQSAPEQLFNISAADQASVYRDLGQRWIVGNPSLEGSLLNDTLLSSAGQREMEAGVQVQLWRPGERQNAMQRGSAYTARSQAQQAWYQLMIAGRVRDSLAELERADLAVENAASAQLQASRLLEITRRLQVAGAAAEMDVLQAETLLLAAERQVLEADALQVDAERNYQILTGGLSERPAQTHREEQSADEEISNQHPLLQLLQTNLQISDAAILEAERIARGSPTVQLGVRRERGDVSQPYVESLGVSVSIPLSSRRVVNASSSDARALRTDAEVALIQQMRSLTQALHEVEHQLFTVARSLPLSEREHTLAQRQLEMAETAYLNGEVDMTHVVRVMQQARDAETTYRQQQLLQQHLIAQYNQTVGVLP